MRVFEPGGLEGIRKFQAGKPSMYVRFQTAGPLRGFLQLGTEGRGTQYPLSKNCHQDEWCIVTTKPTVSCFSTLTIAVQIRQAIEPTKGCPQKPYGGTRLGNSSYLELC